MKKIHSIRYAAAICIGVIALFLAAAYVINELSNDSGEHEIIFTDEGFSPTLLEVKLGDTVTFTNKSTQEFWPASDVHPSHEVYSEFDPLMPIAQNDSWSFTFNELGIWGFHDHIRSVFEGLITVSEEGIDNQFSIEAIDDCVSIENLGQRRQCWNNFIIAEYEKGGLKQGFAAFAHLYISDASFSEQCHGYTHTLGDLAYETYRTGGELTVSKEVAYCTYGFFHGFMENLILDTGTYEGAREFCYEIEKQLEGDTKTVGPCIHGIGHGVTDGSDPRSYGDALKYAEPGLALCDQIGETEYEVKICATGIFNAVAAMFLSDEYGLVLDETDVYATCREYEREVFREACYEDFKIIPLAIESDDLELALQHAVNIPDDLHYRQIAVDMIALMHIYSVRGNDFEYSINTCNALDEQYRPRCIQGLTSGFTVVGIPDKEYIRALAFCESDKLNPADVGTCYRRLQWDAIHRFSTETVDFICSAIPEKHHGYCNRRDATAL
jgi:plastocyanin